MSGTIIFTQKFNIEDHNYIGNIEQYNDDTRIHIYKDGEEYLNKIYTGSTDDEYEMLSEIEKLIEG